MKKKAERVVVLRAPVKIIDILLTSCEDLNRTNFATLLRYLAFLKYTPPPIPLGSATWTSFFEWYINVVLVRVADAVSAKSGSDRCVVIKTSD